MKLLWTLLLCSGFVQSAPTQVEHRRRHLAVVLHELRQREVSHLTPAQRSARGKAIRELAAYTAAGRFPENTDYPGWEMPYFIDRFSTRCALAHVIDRSGEPGLVHRLAKQDNHAYVARLLDDPGLRSWLDRHGLTVQEAAFIQAPGLIRPGPDRRRLKPPQEPGDPPPTGYQAREKDPEHEQPEAGDAPTAPSTLPGDLGGVRRPRRTKSSTDWSWEAWWEYNRAEHVNLRARYHERFVVSPLGSRVGSAVRPRRLGRTTFSRDLHPLFERLGKRGKLRATALFAWARTAMAGPQSEAAVEAILAYLGAARQPHRDLMILALGVSREAAAFDPLVDILRDTAAGRKALARTRPIPERHRAMAALALGAMGDPDAVEELEAVLKSEFKLADLARTCVAALGRLAQPLDKTKRKHVAQVLAAHLEDEHWPLAARVAIPAALLRAGESRHPLLFLARFKEPREVRRSCALALGGAPPTPDLVEVLEAAALRDSDAMVRRFAAVALGGSAGSLARGRTIDESAEARIDRFFEGVLNGLYKNSGDRPFQALGAALFARRFGAHADRTAKQLSKLARARNPRLKSAAILGLGLLQRRDLLAKIKRAKDPVVRAYLAEARGLAGDKSARKQLLDLCTSDKSDRVRYHAALGLGLLGDPTVIEPLVAQMRRERSQPAQAALTLVIGVIGDRAAIAPLAAIAADQSEGLWTRRRALGALAVIGQPGDAGWVQAYLGGVNYTVDTPSFRTLLSLF